MAWLAERLAWLVERLAWLAGRLAWLVGISARLAAPVARLAGISARLAARDAHLAAPVARPAGAAGDFAAGLPLLQGFTMAMTDASAFRYFCAADLICSRVTASYLASSKSARCQPSP